MAVAVLADTGFLVALLNRSDKHNRWADALAKQYHPPWQTCEAVLSEVFHLVGAPGQRNVIELLRRDALAVAFSASADLDRVLTLMQKYSAVPMSFADACLVKMTEAAANSMVLTTDSDFRVYRRHDRQMIPCTLPF